MFHRLVFNLPSEDAEIKAVLGTCRRLVLVVKKQFLFDSARVQVRKEMFLTCAEMTAFAAG